MPEPHDVLLAPVVSEKSYSLLEKDVYVFIVHPDATKPQIRQAVEDTFEVRVKNVNTLNRKGKLRRNRRNNTIGVRSDTKRAIVTLYEGDSISIFEN